MALSVLSACADATVDPLDATLRLDIDNCRGLTHQRATAVRATDGLALTVAHPFYVDGQLSVASLGIFNRSGERLDAELVYADLATDVALLRLTQRGEGLELSEHDGNESARLASFGRSSDMPELRTIEIGQSVEVTLDGDGARQALELVGQIEPGESGAPVLDTDGRIIGIVFAASKTDRTGWAIASEEFVAVLSQPLSALALDCP